MGGGGDIEPVSGMVEAIASLTANRRTSAVKAVSLPMFSRVEQHPSAKGGL